MLLNRIFGSIKNTSFGILEVKTMWIDLIRAIFYAIIVKIFEVFRSP